jgi:ethanolamine ammonia-lyase large subunit
LFGHTYQFKIKTVLAKANELKSGDISAGMQRKDAAERIAAKIVLSELTRET